jgi:hypothetical protein
VRVCPDQPLEEFSAGYAAGPDGAQLPYLIRLLTIKTEARLNPRQGQAALRCFAAKSLGSRKQFGLGRRLFFCRWNGAGMTPFVNSFQVPKVQVRVGCRSRNISVPEQLLNDPQVTPFSSSGRELPQD